MPDRADLPLLTPDTQAEDQLLSGSRRTRESRSSRLRGRNRCGCCWHPLLLELIYVMLELFTARFFSKHPTMSKPDIPVGIAFAVQFSAATRVATTAVIETCGELPGLGSNQHALRRRINSALGGQLPNRGSSPDALLSADSVAILRRDSEPIAMGRRLFNDGWGSLPHSARRYEPRRFCGTSPRVPIQRLEL